MLGLSKAAGRRYIDDVPEAAIASFGLTARALISLSCPLTLCDTPNFDTSLDSLPVTSVCTKVGEVRGHLFKILSPAPLIMNAILD